MIDRVLNRKLGHPALRETKKEIDPTAIATQTSATIFANLFATVQQMVLVSNPLLACTLGLGLADVRDMTKALDLN